MRHMHHDTIKTRASRLACKFTAELKNLFHIIAIHTFDRFTLVLTISSSFQFQSLSNHATATVNQFSKGFPIISMNRTLQEMHIHIVDIINIHVKYACMRTFLWNLHWQCHRREASTDEFGPVLNTENVNTAIISTTTRSNNANRRHHDTIVENNFIFTAFNNKWIKQMRILFFIRRF